MISQIDVVIMIIFLFNNHSRGCMHYNLLWTAFDPFNPIIRFFLGLLLLYPLEPLQIKYNPD